MDRAQRVDRPTVCILGAVERELTPIREPLASSEGLAALPQFIATGAGKASAAIAATRASLERRPSLIGQAGCAGAFRAPWTPEIGLGDVVVASSDVFADVVCATTERFLDLADLGLAVDEDDRGVLHNEVPTWQPPTDSVEAVRSALPGALHSGRLITVSTCSGTDELAAAHHARWQPLAESMEGAAVALACHKFGCRFLEIRGISNYVGARDPSSWNIDLACERAARAVELFLHHPRLVESLPSQDIPIDE